MTTDLHERISTDTTDEPARKRLRPGIFHFHSLKRVRHVVLLESPIESNPEDVVGITQFVSNHDGFDGIIKYR